MRILLVAAVLLVTVLAGCGSKSQPSDSTPPVDGTPSTHYAFRAPVEIATGLSEPSIAVATDGTIYFTAIRGLPSESHVWRSDDHGAKWTELNPHATGGAAMGLGFGGGDTDIAVDGNGRVGMSDLWAGSAAFWISSDKGATWSGSPSSGAPVEDRNWITATKESFFHVGRVFVGGATTCAQMVDAPGPGSGAVWTTKGVVWNDQNAQQNGGLAADMNSGMLYDSYTVNGGIAIARSPDCATWESFPVVSGGGDYGFVFAPVAIDTKGNVYVAWIDNVDGNTHLRYAASADQGATWSKPVDVSPPDYTTLVFPWIAAGSDGRIAVSALASKDAAGHPEQVEQDASWDLVTEFVQHAVPASGSTPDVHHALTLATMHKGTVSVSGLGGGADRSLGDFFETAVDPTDGSLVLGFATGGAQDNVRDLVVQQSDGPSLIEGRVVGQRAASV